MTYGICDGLWMKIILDDFKVKYEGPIKLFCDNNSAISIAHNPVQYDKTKHIKIDKHSIKEKLNSGLVITTHVPTRLQVANIFTKGLSTTRFQELNGKLKVLLWNCRIKDAHEGGLRGHFWKRKTYESLHEHFYWPHMRRDMHRICERYLVYRVAKAKVSPQRLHTPLPIPTTPWVDLSMDFGRDSIFVVVDRFSNMSHFIPFHKVNNVCHVANLFFKEVVRLCGLLNTIVLDRDSKYISHFLRTLWSKLDTKILFSTTCHPQTDRQIEVVNITLSQLLKCFVASMVNLDGLSKDQFVKKLHEKT
ncbi:hypothetical protein CR513_27403, partial [Mucuna pruriens]